MTKQEIIDTLKKLDNGGVCNAFTKERPYSDSCEGCPLADEEGLCTIEILINEVKATM